ncbi:MAG: siroheme synthase [Rhodospirillales bacterium]|jgi:precorrin-2 dehydrogenase/sirohydrochlorin ferrochelatase|nr:siroheme synthase [Rhodospirillales bacterium]
MLPLAIDVAALPVALVGHGPAAVKRLALLREAGAGALELYAPDSDPDLLAAGAEPRLPSEHELAGLSLLFVAGLDAERAAPLARLARDYAVLVNVEDVNALCDLHVPSVVRRGDLVVAISTGGKSPTLAQKLRGWIDGALDQSWGVHLRELSDLRERLRGAGFAPDAVRAACTKLIDEKSWLPTDLRAQAGMVGRPAAHGEKI